MLAGRDHELELLGALVGDLARGRGSAALVEGEPGIGKTALVRAAAGSDRSGEAGRTSLRRGCQVLWGTSDELGQDLPLLPFLDALGVRRHQAGARREVIAGLLRGENAPDPGSDVPAVLAEQLIALVIEETAVRPVVLVIDDLQWADPASVALWGRLARTAGQMPLLLVGITRTAGHRGDLLALRRVVPEGHHVQVDALPQEAVSELVAGLAGGPPDSGLLALAGGAAGNPLYLTELVAALRRSGGLSVAPDGTARLTAAAVLPGAVPGSLAAAIADRLSFVSPRARDMLRAAALLGTEFTVDDLAVVHATAVAELLPVVREAQASGLLADAGDGTALAFRHPLIREALYAELPPAARRAWHFDAGRALAAAGAAPVRVARQLLRAVAETRDDRSPEADGPAAAWILGWLADSAESLVAQAPGVAAGLLGRALGSAPGGLSRHGQLASLHADALYRTGDRATAEQVAARALDSATDPDLIVGLHWTLAQCRMLEGRAQESIGPLADALSAPGITARHQARLRVLTARTCLYLGAAEAADAEASSALEAAAAAADTWAAGWALHVRAAAATTRGRPADALLFCDQALTVADDSPALADLRLLLQVNKAIMLFILDRFDEGLQTAQRARRQADQAGTTLRRAQAHGAIGQALFESGQWDEALATLAVVPAGLKEPLMAAYELGIAAQVAFLRGQTADARRSLTDAQAHAQLARTAPVPPLLLAQAMEREHSGAPGEALAVLRPAIDATAGTLTDTGELHGEAVRLALQSGDAGTAWAVARQAGELATRLQIPHLKSNALYCRGLADRDAGALLSAAQQYSAAGRPLHQARALEAAAECLAAAGDRTAARKAYNQALEVYELLGAETQASRVRSQARGHGIRQGPRSRHRRAVAGWEALTDTELKVTALVKEGLTNPEIAAKLTVSPRTIATHVSHILKKLSLATRTDIAREAALRRDPGSRPLDPPTTSPTRTATCPRTAAWPVRRDPGTCGLGLEAQRLAGANGRPVCLSRQGCGTGSLTSSQSSSRRPPGWRHLGPAGAGPRCRRPPRRPTHGCRNRPRHERPPGQCPLAGDRSGTTRRPDRHAA